MWTALNVQFVCVLGCSVSALIAAGIWERKGNKSKENEGQGKRERKGKRVKYTNTNHMQLVCICLSTWVLQTFLSGSGSFCVHGCIFMAAVYKWEQGCVFNSLASVFTAHTQVLDHRKRVSHLLGSKACQKYKNRAEERHNHKNTDHRLSHFRPHPSKYWKTLRCLCHSPPIRQRHMCPSHCGHLWLRGRRLV